ncbi:glutathione S-transferase family protein [Shewanella sp. OMA3-2]|uniref:glutathione S-transferase family protein n=1 Tax=Shewanella sp. OMA3-2 TaxID=2908650 RepID=UPI001F43FB8A|nr:glutathione S-transferase family protein [Shewanella sp. OMA3-2]UJF20832.1 glutathione S-transferase family protein [Shewanella sp. OMA3-2]
MRFINLDHSAFAARVKIQILHKKLPIEIIAPSYALRTPEFLTTFPLGKIPLLELDNGDYLPESTAIMEYLEDIYPQTTCRPEDPLDKAKMHVTMAYADTHLWPALMPYFKSLLMPEFEFDKKVQFELLSQTLSKFDRWLVINNSNSQGFYKANIDLGDMALFPIIWYVKTIIPMFHMQNVFADVPVIKQWQVWMDENAAVLSVAQSMDTAFHAFLKSKQEIKK